MNILLLVFGLIVLVIGGDLLVRGASGLAFKAKIPPMIVGLTIVSIGTSAPELLVSLQAAIKGVPDIAVGNVVGSNIVNISLILGLTVLIFPLPVDRKTITQDWPIMMSASILLFVFGIDGQISSGEGWILTITLILFTGYLIIRTRWEGPGVAELNVPALTKKFSGYGWFALFILLGCVGLKYGSDWFVEGAVGIAEKLGMSDNVIGVTVVAFGTSVPELTASVVAAFKKESEISLGNLIGSNIFNILGVLGITSIIIPLGVSDAIMSSDIYWMLGVAAVLFPLMVFKNKISRIGGGILVISYTTYVSLVLS